MNALGSLKKALKNIYSYSVRSNQLSYIRVKSEIPNHIIHFMREEIAIELCKKRVKVRYENLSEMRLLERVSWFLVSN